MKINSKKCKNGTHLQSFRTQNSNKIFLLLELYKQKKAARAVSDKVLPLSLSLRQPPNHASELLILTSPFYNLAFYFALMKRSKNSDVKLHKAM